MSLQTPTTQSISDNLIAQMESSLGQTIPLLPKSFTRVLAKALAGVFILLYKYGGWTHLQQYASTASMSRSVINGVEVRPLVEWGRLVGAEDPRPAVQARLLIVVKVVTQGGTLPAGTALVGEANGVTYLTVSAVTLNSASVLAQIQAVSDQTGGDGSGAVGNLSVNDVVSFVNPLADVSRSATVNGTTTIGTDAESEEDYRLRVFARFQRRPQGGAYADYAVWGKTVAGIANIYPYTSSTPGRVDVYVEAASTVDGIPTSDQLNAVAAAIELDDAGLATRRPAGALVSCQAITRTSFDIEVADLVVDNLAQVQADITSAVEELFLSREPFIVGLTPLPRRDRITDSGVTAVVADIVDAAGGVFTGVEILLSTVPVTLYTLDEGEKAKAGSVTFV